MWAAESVPSKSLYINHKTHNGENTYHKYTIIPVKETHVHWKQQVEVSSTDVWTAVMLPLLVSPPTQQDNTE